MAKGANAVLALSRALYGKRLTEADYDALVNCKTLTEFTGVLKSKPEYEALLSAPGVIFNILLSKKRSSRFCAAPFRCCPATAKSICCR